MSCVGGETETNTNTILYINPESIPFSTSRLSLYPISILPITIPIPITIPNIIHTTTTTTTTTTITTFILTMSCMLKKNTPCYCITMTMTITITMTITMPMTTTPNFSSLFVTMKSPRK